MEREKEVCLLAAPSGETANAIFTALDELLTASGEGLVAFDESDNVVFSTRLADQILDIRTAGNSARITAQIMTVKDARPVHFTELAAGKPAIFSVKTASGDRLISVRGIPARRVFMLQDADAEPQRGESDQGLLDIVAHDLRGGMVPAKTYAQMLLSSAFGTLTDKQAEAARVIDASLTKQEDRIANVLDMVKAAENRLEIQRETVSLIDVVRQAAASLEREIRRKGVELKCDLDESAALVQADARRLQRVLVSLLARSLKHSAQGQAMSIELRYPAQNRARLRIWDTGAGSSPADMEILQKGSRERSKQPVDKHSANIDIAAVVDIVRAHDGELEVQTAARTGTSYVLSLPVQRRANAGT